MEAWLIAFQSLLIAWLLYKVYAHDEALNSYKEYRWDLHALVLDLQQEVRELQDWQDKKDMQELAANLGMDNAAAGTD